MISPIDETFKASDKWLDLFLKRHSFSLRKLNEKAAFQTEEFRAVSDKSKQAAYEIIKANKIDPSMIINMDESPFYWEYLPKKVVVPKMQKNASGWKRNFHNHRSTLTLAVAANGAMLRPGLVVKEKKPYVLKCENDINLLVQHSENGWANEVTIIEWLQKILLPYVKTQNCLLIWDTYEAHISNNVLSFLNKHKNIKVHTIVGGMTSTDQPLDISVN